MRLKLCIIWYRSFTTTNIWCPDAKIHIIYIQLYTFLLRLMYTDAAIDKLFQKFLTKYILSTIIKYIMYLVYYTASDTFKFDSYI